MPICRSGAFCLQLCRVISLVRHNQGRDTSGDARRAQHCFDSSNGLSCGTNTTAHLLVSSYVHTGFSMLRTPVFALIFASTFIHAATAAQPASRWQIQDAQERIRHAQRDTLSAIQSGDVASTAVARAKLNAARARAWGLQHPAPVPATKRAIH